VLFAAAFAAVVPIAYWWGRLLGLPATVAIGCAALAVACPWLAYGTTVLDVVPAWPLTTLALLAIWRALVAPSAAADILAAAAVLVAAIARVGNGVVGVALPVGAVVMALRDGGSPRMATQLLWRQHRVIIVLVGAALAVLAVRPHALIGGYPLRTAAIVDVLRELRIAWEQIADGSALVPVVVVTAWVLRSIIRPRDRTSEAFGIVLLVAFLALAYAASTQAPEERYVVTLAPMVAVGFGAALWRREVPVLIVAVVGLLMTWALTVGAPVPGGAYGYLYAPSATWMHQTVFGRVSLALPFLNGHVAVVIGVALGAAAVILVLLRPRRTIIVAATAALSVYGLAAGIWAQDKFVTQAGLSQLSYTQQAWVDRAAPHEYVGIVDFDAEGNQPFFGTWRDVQIFNPQVRARVDFGRNSTLNCCVPAMRRATLRVDPATGLLRSSGRMPDLLLTITTFLPYGLPWREVAASDYLPQRVSLGRLAGRHVRYAWLRGDFAGHLGPSAPLVLRAYRPGPDTCALAYVDAAAGPTLRVGRRQLPLSRAADGALQWRLGRYGGRPAVDLALRAVVPARLAAFDVSPCR